MKRSFRSTWSPLAHACSQVFRSFTTVNKNRSLSACSVRYCVEQMGLAHASVSVHVQKGPAPRQSCRSQP